MTLTATTGLPRPAFFRIKAASLDLVDRCGGIERSAAICGYSKSQVHRWTDRNGADLICLVAIVALEAECGEPLVTRAMAAVAGLETAPKPSSATSVMGAYVEMSRAAEHVHGEVGEALRDGEITPDERLRLEEAASVLDRATEKFREGLAAADRKILRMA